MRRRHEQSIAFRRNNEGILFQEGDGGSVESCGRHIIRECARPAHRQLLQRLFAQARHAVGRIVVRAHDLPPEDGAKIALVLRKWTSSIPRNLQCLVDEVRIAQDLSQGGFGERHCQRWKGGLDLQQFGVVKRRNFDNRVINPCRLEKTSLYLLHGVIAAGDEDTETAVALGERDEITERVARRLFE